MDVYGIFQKGDVSMITSDLHATWLHNVTWSWDKSIVTLALESYVVVLSSKSCFCVDICPSPFPPSLLALVSVEVGTKYLHWVSHWDSAWWWFPIPGLLRIPVHPAWPSHFAWHHHLLSWAPSLSSSMRVVQYCDIMRFMIPCDRHHSVPLP